MTRLSSLWEEVFSDDANQEIGAPGNDFPPMKTGLLWKVGVLTRP
jgi:hypothetical protein